MELEIRQTTDKDKEMLDAVVKALYQCDDGDDEVLASDLLNRAINVLGQIIAYCTSKVAKDDQKAFSREVNGHIWAVVDDGLRQLEELSDDTSS